jgi:hypothetical protein
MGLDFNGSTLEFGSDQTPLLSIDTTNAVSEVPVAGASDTDHLYEAGVPTRTVTWTVSGDTTLAKGDKDELVIAWNDGGAHGSITLAVITNVSKSGAEDGPISSSITAIPTQAD